MFGRNKKSETAAPLPYPAPMPGSNIPAPGSRIPDQRPKWLQEAENKGKKRRP